MATSTTDSRKKKVIHSQKTAKPIRDIKEYEEKKRQKVQRKIEKKLDKEYMHFRREFEDLRMAYKYCEDIGPHDDIYGRLLQLEKVTKRIRKGGLFSQGAKSHKKLLGKLKKTPVEY